MADAGLKAIFLARRGLIERLVKARVGTGDEAEDIMQELWLRIEQVKAGPVNDPVAYLLRMAMNLVTDRSLNRRRRQDREGAWQALQPVSAEFPDQESRLVAHAELARVQAVLDQMPGHMTRALIMFRLEGLSQRAIADELGMSVSGVEKLLSRAYRQLAEMHKDNAVGTGTRTGAAFSRKSTDVR